MKKLFFFTTFIFLKIVIAMADTQNIYRLSADNANWTSVIGGQALCQTQETSYGFVTLTDGKLISACTENGIKLWEKGLPAKPEKYFCVISKDFLIAVTNKKNLHLINPSGLILWTNKLKFAIADTPIQGLDGRIFVRGKKEIACFGINGKCKWEITTDSLSELPLTQMNDGTIVAIKENLANGKSVGIRITPFGEIVETIEFTSEISKIFSCEQGALVSFKDGGFGLCSVKNNKINTKWSIMKNDFCFENTIISRGTNFTKITDKITAIILSSSNFSSKIILFENASGKVTNIFHADGLDYTKLSCSSSATKGNAIFLSDNKKAIIYDLSGNLIWQALLPDASSRAGNWNFINFTKNNYIIVASKSWVINGFGTIQKIKSKTNLQNKKVNSQNKYEKFYTILPFHEFSSLKENPERKKHLQEGYYAQKECEYFEDIMSICNGYCDFLSSKTTYSLNSQSVFKTNKIELQSIISEVALFGTDESSKVIARIIQTETDSDNFYSLLKAASQTAYDPNELMLKAIQILLPKIPPRDTTTLIETSNAVYEICRFMGRPAFYSHCLEIQKTLLNSPLYSEEVKSAVRENLKRTIALKI